MCRSIKQLRNLAEPPTDAEIQAAALQFVRKVSGYRKPSAANQAAFDAAVVEIADATQRLLGSLVTRPQPLASPPPVSGIANGTHEHQGVSS
jgi:hypothetical protein